MQHKGVGRPLLRILFQQLAHHLIDLIRQPADLARLLELAVAMLVQEVEHVSPTNGGRPISSVYSTTPSEYRSLRFVIGLPEACSGERNSAVPTHAAGGGQVRGRKHLGNAEIRQLDFPSEDAGRRVRSTCRWRACRRRSRPGDVAALAPASVSCRAARGYLLDVLHRVEVDVVLVTGLVEADDVPGCSSLLRVSISR